MTAPPTVIAGWTSTDRVPGVAAETLFAAGGISVGSLPVKCLITGTKTSAGSATPNQDVVQLFSKDDADAKLGPGSEGARQAYIAIDNGGDDLLLEWAGPPEASGAAAGTGVILIKGTWTAGGDWDLQLDGEDVTAGVAVSDTPHTLATTIASVYNSDPRRPCTATTVAGTSTDYMVVFTSKSKGIRQNDHALYLNTTRLPSGCTMSIQGAAWTNTTTFATGYFVVPTTPNGFLYKCTSGGAGSTTTEPTWPVTVGTTVVDSGATFTCWAPTLTNGGIRFGGASGTEDITTLLGILFSGTYDYIASAQYDASNAARWKTQINTKAGPTENRIDRVIMGQTGTLTAAEALAQTTANDFRMQVLWHQNSEAVPSRIAAAMAGKRAVTEPGNPSAIYDDYVLVGIPPQRAQIDFPSHTTLMTALLNSLTPIKTENNAAKVVMSVTTYSLFGSTPDYRCLQTYYEVVPDTIRRDVALRWVTEVKPVNPHVADDPAPEEKERPAGIWTPQRATAWETGILREYETAGHVIDVDQNLPTSGFDPVPKRVVSVLPVKVAPGNHQFGLSVRQLAA